MLKRFIMTMLMGLALPVLTSCTHQREISQDELLRDTQELFNSVAAGDQTPWKKYFADDCLYFDEKGRKMDKTALIADVTPLPPGYFGGITVARPKSHIEGDVESLAMTLTKQKLFSAKK